MWKILKGPSMFFMQIMLLHFIYSGYNRAPLLVHLVYYSSALRYGILQFCMNT